MRATADDFTYVAGVALQDIGRFAIILEPYEVSVMHMEYEMLNSPM